MNAPFLGHFGLRFAPFSKDIVDSELWLPSSKQALVDTLCDALEERQSALLVGDAGAGKTCLLRALRQRVSKSGFRLTYCHNATLGRRDFYRQLCLALGLSPSATAAAVFFAVSSHVEALGHEKIHPVFLLDEAHLLHYDTLDHLHILLNYEWDSRPLLSLVLVGLPELEDRLTFRKQRSLYSRIHCRLRIEPFSIDDTAEYLKVRLTRAACDRDLFAHDAISVLHEATGGAMRDLDRLATACLRDAAKRKKKCVDAELAALAVALDCRNVPAST